MNICLYNSLQKKMSVLNKYSTQINIFKQFVLIFKIEYLSLEVSCLICQYVCNFYTPVKYKY